MPKNRIILQWDSTALNIGKMKRESFKSGSPEKAKDLVFRRNINNIDNAVYYDGSGEETIILCKISSDE